MIATYCVEGRWYYIDGATLIGGNIHDKERYRIFTGWVWVREKKYYTDTTVTLFGQTLVTPGSIHPEDKVKHNEYRSVALEMRRNLTVKTLKNGPPVYIIQEQTLT